MTTRMNKRISPKQGFTLVEMMVALTAGAIAMTSIYYVSAASSQHFHEQQMIANMQTALRLAIDRVRSDLQRAAFLGSVNPGIQDEGAFCGGTYGSAANGLMGQGVWLVDGAYTSQLIEPVVNTDIEADQLRMVGNYATADEYYAEVIDTNRLRVDIQRQSFRRSFGTSDLTSHEYDAAFEDAFAPGRGVRIVGSTGRVSLHQITTVDGDAGAGPEFTIAPDITGIAPTCMTLGDDVLVAPQVRIEYYVSTWKNAAGEKFHGSDVLTGQNAPALMRRELAWHSDVTKVNEMADATLVPPADFSNNQQVVLEHVAHFDVDFFRDLRLDLTVKPDATAGTADAPPFFQGDTVADVTNSLHSIASVSAGTALGPHRVRSAIVELSVRAPSEDPRFAWIARGVNAPLTRYEIDPDVPGAARVRTVRTEVFLPNFAYRGKIGD
jgi:prepilin-type N-terminal cleavage/methylation domain-containing protein